MAEITDPNISQLNFVKRFLFPNGQPTIPSGDGRDSTHKMWSSDKMAFPQIVQMPDGSLNDLKTADAAREYALRTGEFISFPTEAEAQAFAGAEPERGGYKALWGAGEAGVSPESIATLRHAAMMGETHPQSARPTIQEGVPRMFVNTGGDIWGLKDLVDIRPTMEKLGDDFPPPVQSELQRLP